MQLQLFCTRLTDSQTFKVLRTISENVIDIEGNIRLFKVKNVFKDRKDNSYKLNHKLN